MAINEFFIRLANFQIDKAKQAEKEAAKKLYEEAAQSALSGDIKGVREKASLADQHVSNLETISKNEVLFHQEDLPQVTDTWNQRFGIPEPPVEVLTTLFSDLYKTPEAKNKENKQQIQPQERKKRKRTYKDDLTGNQLKATVASLGLEGITGATLTERWRTAFNEEIQKKAVKDNISVDDADGRTIANCKYYFRETRRKLIVYLDKLTDTTETETRVNISTTNLDRLLQIIRKQNDEKLEEIEEILGIKNLKSSTATISETPNIESEPSSDNKPLSQEEMFLLGRSINSQWFESRDDYELILHELKQRPAVQGRLNSKTKNLLIEKLLLFKKIEDEVEIDKYMGQYDEFGQILLSLIKGKTGEEIKGLFLRQA